MPLQINISQPSGAIAAYHVIMNCNANFGATNNASVTINSYVSQAAFAASYEPLGSFNQFDISPLVNNPAQAAPSLLSIIEQYLLTTPTFNGAIQVN